MFSLSAVFTYTHSHTNFLDVSRLFKWESQSRHTLWPHGEVTFLLLHSKLYNCFTHYVQPYNGFTHYISQNV